MTPQEMLQDISENWFLKEPAFYSLLCLQQKIENPTIECPIRCGEGRIEYNPLLLAKKNYKETEQLLRIEMIRLFLKHPYERRPEGCSGETIALGSDCTIADGYCLLKEAGALKGPGYYHLPMGESYEWYCKQIEGQKGKNQDEGNNPPSSEPHSNQPQEGNNQPHNTEQQENLDRSALWHDDALMQTRINDLIDRTNDWGSLAGDIVERIKASTKARLNRSMVFQGFKSNLLSADRILTRMRPNRRTGFQQMGSRREIRAHLLIAIDVSGSIDTPTLSRFYSVVNKLFLDSNIEIDEVPFDAAMGQIHPLHNIELSLDVKGRGGTNFQPVVDYFLKSRNYDGLMILTDGEAPPPTVDKKRAPILWVCKDEACYNNQHRWMERSGRCCWI